MVISHPLLGRHTMRPAPAISLLPGADELCLAQGRVHEVSGPARRTFAMWLAAQTEGPVIWIVASWEKDRLGSDGVSAWIDPARLLFVTPRRGEDLLWTMEEVLRSGAVSLAIADLPDLPGLTQVRRMHLAGETGAQTCHNIPLGLLVTPGQGGAPGVETRWHMKSSHSTGEDGWHLQRLRARTAPHKSWQITQPAARTGPEIKTA